MMAFIFRITALGDGVVDPYLLCNTLIKASKNSIVLEDCNVKEILFDQNEKGKKVKGVSTDHGVIKADCVVNARGI